jgi:hypothetical protein
MKSLLRISTTFLFVVFVAFSLGAAANAVYAEWSDTCNGEGEIGVCPDFGSSTAEDAACNCACQVIFSYGGSCDVSGCCLCQT